MTTTDLDRWADLRATVARLREDACDLTSTDPYRRGVYHGTEDAYAHVLELIDRGQREALFCRLCDGAAIQTHDPVPDVPGEECLARHKCGYLCSNAPGHDGPHEARISATATAARWATQTLAEHTAAAIERVTR